MEAKARRPAKAIVADDVSEAQIAVHWQEEGYFAPPKEFVAQSNLRDKSIFKRFALEKFPGYYKEFAELLDWYKKWDKIFDGSNPPFWKWYVGGKINACYNCVDRHLASQRNKTAIHFVPELEHEPIQHVTYQELWVRVNEFAALLRDFCGLKAGDRVTLHMPMVAELPITMLACARLGVIHSQVFSGFSGKACADHHGCVLPRWQASRPQGEGRYRGGGSREGRPQAREGACLAALSGQVLERDQARRRPRFRRQRTASQVSRQAHRGGADAGGGAALSHVHERHYRQAEGRAAFDRRLSLLRDMGLEIHAGQSSPGCLLVHGRHRLDHRALIHRVRAARAGGLLGDLRRCADASRSRPSLAHRAGARRQHLPYVAYGDPRAAQGWP